MRFVRSSRWSVYERVIVVGSHSRTGGPGSGHPGRSGPGTRSRHGHGRSAAGAGRSRSSSRAVAGTSQVRPSKSRPAGRADCSRGHLGAEPGACPGTAPGPRGLVGGPPAHRSPGPVPGSAHRRSTGSGRGDGAQGFDPTRGGPPRPRTGRRGSARLRAPRRGGSETRNEGKIDVLLAEVVPSPFLSLIDPGAARCSVTS